MVMKYHFYFFCLMCFYSCHKDKISGGLRKGTYEYQFSTRAGSYFDTTNFAFNELKAYTIEIGEFNELNTSYSMAIQENGNTVAFYKIDHNTFELESCESNTLCLYRSFCIDSDGNGIEKSGFYLNGAITPPMDPPYMNVVDYPFKGWNRFTLK